MFRFYLRCSEKSNQIKSNLFWSTKYERNKTDEKQEVNHISRLQHRQKPMSRWYSSLCHIQTGHTHSCENSQNENILTNIRRPVRFFIDLFRRCLWKHSRYDVPRWACTEMPFPPSLANVKLFSFFQKTDTCFCVRFYCVPNFVAIFPQCLPLYIQNEPLFSFEVQLSIGLYRVLCHVTPEKGPTFYDFAGSCQF